MYLRGAHVTSFKVAGVEWIGMRADCKLDGTKQNISGGLQFMKAIHTLRLATGSS